MADNRDIIECIREMSGTKRLSNVFYVDAVVDSVDIETRTCEVTVNDGKSAYQLTASLMASVDDGILVEPELDSNVKVVFSETVDAVIVQFSAIKNITFIAGTKIKLNGDSLGGLVEIIPLIAWMTKVKVDLTTIQAALNGLGVPVAITADTPTQSNFENTKVVHGS